MHTVVKYDDSKKSESTSNSALHGSPHPATTVPVQLY